MKNVLIVEDDRINLSCAEMALKGPTLFARMLNSQRARMHRVAAIAALTVAALLHQALMQATDL